MLGLSIILAVAFLLNTLFIIRLLSVLGETMVKLQRAKLSFDELTSAYDADKAELEQYRLAHRILREVVERAQGQQHEEGVNIFRPDDSVN